MLEQVLHVGLYTRLCELFITNSKVYSDSSTVEVHFCLSVILKGFFGQRSFPPGNEEEVGAPPSELN